MPQWNIRESALVKRLQSDGAEASPALTGAADGGVHASGDAPSTSSGANPSPLLSVPMPGAGSGPSAPADLLSLDPVSSGPVAANGSAAAPAAVPPKPANTVDLLSDLFGDVVVSSAATSAPVPAPAAPAYPGAPAAAAAPAPYGFPPAPVAAAPVGYPGYPTGGGFPPAPVAAAPVTANPFGGPAAPAAVPPPVAANPFAPNPFPGAAPAPAPMQPAAVPPPTMSSLPSAATMPRGHVDAMAPMSSLPAAATMPRQVSADPFGDSGFGGAPAFGAPPVAAAPQPVPPPVPTGDVEAWYSALLLKVGHARTRYRFPFQTGQAWYHLLAVDVPCRALCVPEPSCLPKLLPRWCRGHRSTCTSTATF